MGAPETPPIPLPQSYTAYADKNFTDIKLSHHPASSPTATPVIVLILHRPKANNAFTEHMADEMVRAFHMFDVDDRVKAIIVTGQGRFFCPGADLNVGFGKGSKAGRERIGEHRDGYVFVIDTKISPNVVGI
jgi:enoyl-CoA hydratase/carnithine racemase